MAKHIITYGVGAVGGFYSGKLAAYLQEQPGAFCLSLVSRGRCLEELKAKGLELTLVDGGETTTNIYTNFDLYSSFAEINFQAEDEVIVLLCVKSKDTQACAEDIATNLPTNNAYVISVQNGVENEETIASVLGIERTVGSITNVAAEMPSYAKYIQKGGYGLFLGELPQNKSNTRLDSLVELFNKIHITTTLKDDVLTAAWSKLVWNSSYNPLSALYEMEIGPLVQEHSEEILGIMNETVQVAKSLGIALDDDVAQKHFDRTNHPDWKTFKTSMYQDVLAGKGNKLEVKYLLGVIVRKAAELKLAVPFAEQTYSKVCEKFSLQK